MDINMDMYDSTFFKPDRELINWLVEYLGDRHFVDMGCGEGKLTESLFYAKGKGMGVDLYNFPNWHLIKMKAIDKKLNIHLLRCDVTTPDNFAVKLVNGNEYAKAVAIFARPCHSRFVEDAIDLMDSGAEILYITIPENLYKYDDLGKYDEYKELLPHKGTSVNNEVIYRIIKP